MDDDIRKAKLDELEELQAKAAKIEEYIEREERKQEQLKAQLRQLKAKKSSEKRKLDAHRKIVVGATIMATFPEYDLTDKDTLDKFVSYLDTQRKWISKAMNKQQSERSYHVRGSLDEILGEDIEVTPIIKDKGSY